VKVNSKQTFIGLQLAENVKKYIKQFYFLGTS